MKVSAIAFDLDDTMLLDDRTLSHFTVETLRRAAARGIRIIPASGRARDSMRPFVDQLGCVDAYIACNGAEIWSPRHEVLRRFDFPDAVAQDIIAYAREKQCYAHTYFGSRFYYMIENEFASVYSAASLLTGCYTPDLEAFIAGHPTPKVLVVDSEEKIAGMLTEARQRFEGRASITCSKPWFLEFNPPEATKGNALAGCADLLDFDVSACLAFGDSLNDLSMLQATGFGVAVANAREDVRAQVRFTCGRNSEDGPARFIQTHVLTEDGCP